MTIELYNTSEIDARTINLPSPIGTVSTMVGVEFSHPSGVFRLNQFTNATHFKATFAGVEYVYRITGFTAINGGVCEYSYTLDFLKDYFNKHTTDEFKTCGGFVTRSTRNNEDEWDKFADDSQNCFLKGTATTTVTPLNNIFNVNNGCIIVILRTNVDDLKKPVLAYALTSLEYYQMCKALINIDGYYNYVNGDHIPTVEAQKRAIALNQIAQVYYSPINLTSGQSTGITWIGSPTDGSGPVFTISNCNGTSIIPTDQHSFSKVHYYESSNLTDFKDLYLKDYKISIPFFGTYQIDPLRFHLSSGGDDTIHIGFKIVENLIDGTMSLLWHYPNDETNASTCIVSTVPLPTIPIPNASFANATYSQLTTYSNNLANINNSVRLAGLSGFNSPNLFSPIGTTISAEYNKREAALQNVRALASIGATTSQYSGGVGGFTGAVIPNGTVEVTTYDSEYHPEIYGYIINKPLSQVSLTAQGFKYWIDVSSANIGGPKWYAEGVKADIGSDYILIG